MLNKAVEACQGSITASKGRLVVKEAARAVSEKEEKALDEQLQELEASNRCALGALGALGTLRALGAGGWGALCVGQRAADQPACVQLCMGLLLQGAYMGQGGHWRQHRARRGP